MATRYDPLPAHCPYGIKYGTAMEITDQADADAYFERLVEHLMARGQERYTRERAEQIERQNLGYYAGYYDTETRERVERLFKCAHPVFVSVARDAEQMTPD